ncbi:MAG: hypothetical protein ACOYYJ_18505 [Chloroflexota bacterium]
MIENAPREFRPVLLSRRGEWTAWGLFTAAGVGVLALRESTYVPLWAWIFWSFLLFSAVSISLGNWIDRRTFIRLEGDGIRFENGLRRVRLGWPEVQEVAVLPARWGQAVQVSGQRAHFAFKTLGEVEFQGEVRGRTGFVEGRAILDVILRETGLRLVEEANSAYYYARS